jgi:hypothetical protein
VGLAILQVGILFAAMALSAAGVHFVRRRVDSQWLQRHHEIAGYFVTTIGTLYAVLLAFAVFVVWSDFTSAGSDLEREANRVGDLSRMAKALPEPLSSNVRTALITYVRSVLQDEFPAMAEGRDSPPTRQAMHDLWIVFRNADVGDRKSAFYYEESVKLLVELGNFRRVRLFSSHGTVPRILWALLCSGAVLLIGFTYFFALPSVRSQMVMTAALAGFLTFAMLLIMSLNNPYAGSIRVSSKPLQVELSHVLASGTE